MIVVVSLLLLMDKWIPLMEPLMGVWPRLAVTLNTRWVILKLLFVKLMGRGLQSLQIALVSIQKVHY